MLSYSLNFLSFCGSELNENNRYYISVKCLFIATIILLLPLTTRAECEGKETDIEWLSWPIIGVPYKGFYPGILFGPAETRFSIDFREDIIIGLRSDGTVVWKSLKTDRK